MAKSFKKTLKEGYNRLKKVLERAITPKREQPMPSLILEPVRNKNYRRDY